MFGIILIALGVIGKIVQANTWFLVPSTITTGFFICGSMVLAIQIIIPVIITFVAARKVKKFHKGFSDD